MLLQLWRSPLPLEAHSSSSLDRFGWVTSTYSSVKFRYRGLFLRAPGRSGVHSYREKGRVPLPEPALAGSPTSMEVWRAETQALVPNLLFLIWASVSPSEGHFGPKSPEHRKHYINIYRMVFSKFSLSSHTHCPHIHLL